MAIEHFRIVEYAGRSWYLYSTVTFCLLIAWALLRIIIFRPAVTHEESKTATPVSISSRFLPKSISNLQFAANAVRILENGYNKFRTQAFIVERADNNIVVLPANLLEELSRLPATIASPHGALERDLLGPYTGLDIILESRMHHTIVQRKLTPRLASFTPALEEELKSAINEYFPECSAWTEFQPYQILAKVAARLTSRALVGEEFCRDERWLDIAVNYTENLFRTIVIMRLFPGWLHPVIHPLLPSYWQGKRHMANAKALLSPSLVDLLSDNDKGECSPGNDSTVLHWLAGTAKGNDRNAETLAQVEVLLALASVHTTLLRMVNVLYDLTAHKEYLSELRQEISDVYEQEGNRWTAASYDKLHKLDSVLRESQRMSPPTTLGMKRVLHQDHIFSNGLSLQKGTYVCLPIYAIENSPENCSNPETFDGLRSYRLRQQQNQTSNDFSFSSIDPTTLNFGYGKHACPGRHFASLILKMLFVKLLTEYKFEFLRGDGRPKNYTVHEFLFCWPWEKILVRKREGGGCPF